MSFSSVICLLRIETVRSPGMVARISSHFARFSFCLGNGAVTGQMIGESARHIAQFHQ
jgi:hypothetical protein